MNSKNEIAQVANNSSESAQIKLGFELGWEYGLPTYKFILTPGLVDGKTKQEITNAILNLWDLIGKSVFRNYFETDFDITKHRFVISLDKSVESRFVKTDFLKNTQPTQELLDIYKDVDYKLRNMGD